MPLVLGFVALVGAILLVTHATTGASWADVLKGNAGQIYRSQAATAAATSSTGGGSAGAVSSSTGGGSAALSGVSTSVPGHPELKPQISQITNLVLSRFPGLTITSTISGNHASHSYHYIGEAVDISGPPALMDQAAAWIRQNLSSSLLEGIHNGGSATGSLSVKNHRSVSDAFWGAVTWAEHANHIHLAAGTQAP